ncbi:MAG: hypothetical protein LBK59_11725 [Bifidobacteriaceae bacterium]|nr:hypothetical protein [Bifidobacteriaceae bacterium]
MTIIPPAPQFTVASSFNSTLQGFDLFGDVREPSGDLPEFAGPGERTAQAQLVGEGVACPTVAAD